MDKIDLNGANIERLRSLNKIEHDRANEKREEKTTNNLLTPSDQVNVSDRAASVQQIVDKISNIPQVRQDRVEALREQIQSGSFNPSSEDIADAILREDN